MKKELLIMLILISFVFVYAEEYEPELRVEIKPYCYGSNVLIKVEESHIDKNENITWLPSANATVLIKHFGYIIKKEITNENGTIKYKFPLANIYGIDATKEDYEDYYNNEVLLRSCLITPYEPPEIEPYIHIPPIVNPPKILTIDWVRVVMVW